MRERQSPSSASAGRDVGGVGAVDHEVVGAALGVDRR